MGNKATRRQLLALLTGTIGTVLLGRCRSPEAVSGVEAPSAPQALTPSAYLPVISGDTDAPAEPTAVPTTEEPPEPSPVPTTEEPPEPTVGPPPQAGRVVHVHDADATDWDGSGWYGDAVNQAAVDGMVEVGLQTLTGHSSWTDIWHSMFERAQPDGYQPGQKIAIKVNLNNSEYPNGGCTGTGNAIDALPHPVKALVRGLVAAGVGQGDIWIYDATGQHAPGRIIPNRFRAPLIADFPDLQYYGLVESGYTDACFPGIVPVAFGGNTSLTVGFSDDRITGRTLTSLLAEATYLINMPILKRHGIHPVSLGFKNHLGSIDKVNIGADSDQLHLYIDPADAAHYSASYSPLVDIYKNPNIRDKTILTVGDALYGAFGATFEPPVTWHTFGDAPNSLLFSTDPVAIDCVMVDLLAAEGRADRGAYDYLFCAQEAGLGICEGTRANPGGSPWLTPYGSGYSAIEYIRL